MGWAEGRIGEDDRVETRWRRRRSKPGVNRDHGHRIRRGSQVVQRLTHCLPKEALKSILPGLEPIP